MKLAIPTIADEDLDIANSAEIGAESTVKVAFGDTALAGEYEQGASLGAGVWTPENAFKAPAGTAGRDLVVICANGVRSTEEIVIVFGVTLAGLGTPAGTATARFNPPAGAENDTFNFPIGLAVDLNADDADFIVTDVATTDESPVITSAGGNFVAADVGKTVTGAGIPALTTILSRQSATQVTLSADATATATGVDVTIEDRDLSAQGIRTITGIESISGGNTGNRYAVVAFADDWVDVRCAMDKTPTIAVGKSIPIACGYNGARWIKKGRSEPPTLELSAKYTSGGDGLMRLNGHKVTVLIETKKEDRLLTERQLYGNWRPTVAARKGDGDNEAEARATGMYELFAVLV